MQIACCDHILSDVFFASVEVATYAGNIIYFRPAVLVYSLAYSYTFSVIIVFYLVVFSTKMGLLQLPVWPQRCWFFKCHISAELKWERRIVESLNLVFFFFLTTLHCMLCVTAFVCVCVCVPCPAIQLCRHAPTLPAGGLPGDVCPPWEPACQCTRYVATWAHTQTHPFVWNLHWQKINPRKPTLSCTMTTARLNQSSLQLYELYPYLNHRPEVTPLKVFVSFFVAPPLAVSGNRRCVFGPLFPRSVACAVSLDLHLFLFL